MSILQTPLTPKERQRLLDRVKRNQEARRLRDERIKNGTASLKDIEEHKARMRAFELAEAGVLTEYI